MASDRPVSPPLVILDANLLYPFQLRNLLVQFGVDAVITPRWSRGCGLRQLVFVIVGKPRIPALEQWPKRAVERPRSGLQQQMRAALGPLHLLPLGEALADDGVHRAFGQA
jgi:hypothetical protein